MVSLKEFDINFFSRFFNSSKFSSETFFVNLFKSSCLFSLLIFANTCVLKSIKETNNINDFIFIRKKLIYK